MEYRVLESGHYSRYKNSSTKIIKNQKELKSLYLSHNVGVLPPNGETPYIKTPKIDFDTQQVVAFFVGQKSNGGYGVKIDEIDESSDVCTIYYSYTHPSPTSMVVDSITYPYMIIVVNTKKNINLIKQ
jgi:hypothetical protein